MAPLQEAAAPLLAGYDVALLDCDGVVYLGPDAAPHAPEAVAAARARGLRFAFVTNNASRTPDQVAEHLTRLGVPARPEDVVTSVMAAMRLLAAALPAPARVLVAGAQGLREAVAGAGYEVVASADDHPDAVVQGYDPTIDYPRLAEAALAVHRGAVWVATNDDAVVPTHRGPLPGMGSLVALISAATGRRPEVAGKPHPAMHAESVRRSGARAPLVVGDRLDTDIEGANRAATASLLVLTGITGPEDLLAAPPHRRPTYLAEDLRGLLVGHPGASQGRCGAAVAERRGGRVCARGGVELERLRAAATLVWAARDAGEAVERVDWR